ncbi:hypothetical protein F5X99DRAFT_419961 [Biscogniauxia marginata]|nr:hypothetical protein F5X99DRAFT_419961 [Biscogniauxia marginata]
MFERLLKIAKELGEAHSPPEVSEALSQAVPEQITIQDVRDLLFPEDGDAATRNIQDSIAALWAVYAIMKSGSVSEHEHEEESDDNKNSAALNDIAARVGTLMAPVCPSVPVDEEDNTDYAPLALKGSLGLHILDLLTKSYAEQIVLPGSALLSVVAYTRPIDPWSADAAASLAQSLLQTHFRRLAATTARGKSRDGEQQQQQQQRAKFIVADVLDGFLRPLFSRSRPAAVTASGRKAEFVEPARYDYIERETPEAKPWKYTHRYAVTVFEWAVGCADPPLLQSHWPLFTPVLLALLDDPQVTIATPTPTVAEAAAPAAPAEGVKLRALRVLRAFWARLPPALMRDTGLAPVFEQAVFPSVLSLPSLTPEDESAALLGAAYPALFDMAGIPGGRGGGDNSNDDGSNDEQQQRGHKVVDFTEEQRKLLDRIVREGIMTGYHHAKEHVRLVSLFCENLRYLVDGIGILAVKYLKEFIPMVSEILTDPFGTKHPPSLLSATKLLQAILCSCWPRVPRYFNEIVKMLMLCWLNVEDEDAFPDGGPSRTQLKDELTRTSQMLSAIMKAAESDMSERVSPLIEKEPQLRNLFGDHDAK